MLKVSWLLLFSLLLNQLHIPAGRAIVYQDEDVPLNGVIIENNSSNAFKLRLRSSFNSASWEGADLTPGRPGTYIEKDQVQVLYQGRLTADRPLQYQVRYEIVATAWGWDVRPKRK
jgi:hypothetical protein